MKKHRTAGVEKLPKKGSKYYKKISKEKKLAFLFEDSIKLIYL